MSCDLIKSNIEQDIGNVKPPPTRYSQTKDDSWNQKPYKRADPLVQFLASGDLPTRAFIQAPAVRNVEQRCASSVPCRGGERYRSTNFQPADIKFRSPTCVAGITWKRLGLESCEIISDEGGFSQALYNTVDNV